jgi:hypothetical protein
MFVTSVEDTCLTIFFFAEREDIKERVISELVEKLR